MTTADHRRTARRENASPRSSAAPWNNCADSGRCRSAFRADPITNPGDVRISDSEDAITHSGVIPIMVRIAGRDRDQPGTFSTGGVALDITEAAVFLLFELPVMKRTSANQEIVQAQDQRSAPPSLQARLGAAIARAVPSARARFMNI